MSTQAASVRPRTPSPASPASPVAPEDSGRIAYKWKVLISVLFGITMIILDSTVVNVACIIDDDGVGRKEAARRQAHSLQPHISRATQIMQERVVMLREVEDVTVSILIVDKINEEKNAIGTTVVINIV